MLKSCLCALAVAVTVSLAADEQLTIHKVTVNAPSGTISGKVVGTGDKLIFIDDSDPSKSFTLTRGEITKLYDGGRRNRRSTRRSIVRSGQYHFQSADYCRRRQ